MNWRSSARSSLGGETLSVLIDEFFEFSFGKRIDIDKADLERVAGPMTRHAGKGLLLRARQRSLDNQTEFENLRVDLGDLEPFDGGDPSIIV